MSRLWPQQALIDVNLVQSGFKNFSGEIDLSPPDAASCDPCRIAELLGRRLQNIIIEVRSQVSMHRDA